MASGIYRIKNLETGALYIGQTAQAFAKRWHNHRWELGAGCHHNEHLQNSYNKHGKDAFEYKVLEVIPQGDMSDKEFLDYMNEREVILIEEHGAFSNGYNKTEGGGGSGGHRHTPETKAKMSAANKGKKLSEEHKAKLSAALKGKKKSAEHRANIIAALTGNKMSDETKAKMSRSMSGRACSEETKAKISKSLMGHKISKETRAKISASLTGKKRKEIR